MDNLSVDENADYPACPKTGMDRMVNFMDDLSVMQLYHSPPRGASTLLHVREMGLHEVMPPGIIRHGGRGSGYPYLLMIFHSPAWVLSADQKDWLPAQHRLVIWNREAEHHYGNSAARWNHSWLQVTGSLMERLSRHGGDLLGIPLAVGGDGLALRYLRMIFDEVRGSVRQDPDMLEKIMNVFWHDIARRHRARTAGMRPASRLDSARKSIEANFDRPFSLSQAARQANLSPSHFCHSFARRFGTPPREYAMRLRLQRGAQLLANEELAVFQVAEMVGCPDALYFSRLFRKRYGTSPSQYRRQLRIASTPTARRLARTGRARNG